MEWVAIWTLVKKYWWVILAVLGVVAVLIWKHNFAEDQRDIGAAGERSRSLESTVTRVQEANDEKAKVLDPTKYNKFCECLQSATTPSSCERFVPNGHDNTREPASMCKTR